MPRLPVHLSHHFTVVPVDNGWLFGVAESVVSPLTATNEALG
jgi:hypothetical protein